MLYPAIIYKEELTKLFGNEIYNERYFYYSGYAYCHALPVIEARDDYFQWAIVDREKVIGYLAYHIDTANDTVNNFGLYSFDEGNLKVVSDTFKKLEELVKSHHRIEWRVIGGNHVKRGYDRFCKRHNGNIVCLHNVTKNPSGDYVNEYIYEIVNERDKASQESIKLVGQEPKTGHWILDETDNSITCDKCGCLIWANDIHNGEAHYCPNCGYQMESEG